MSFISHLDPQAPGASGVVPCEECPCGVFIQITKHDCEFRMGEQRSPPMVLRRRRMSVLS